MVDLVMRDFDKAFDKVWTLGLQYKILNLNLPKTIEKLTCDYLTDRWAKIYIEDFAGPLFELKAGVPQGGCLSPTLFSIYTADIPEPETRNSIDIYYADDVTQLILRI